MKKNSLEVQIAKACADLDVILIDDKDEYCNFVYSVIVDDNIKYDLNKLMDFYYNKNLEIEHNARIIKKSRDKELFNLCEIYIEYIPDLIVSLKSDDSIRKTMHAAKTIKKAAKKLKQNGKIKKSTYKAVKYLYLILSFVCEEVVNANKSKI